MIPRLCVVPAGEFIIGGKESDGLINEFPPKRIYVEEFYIDETPVTVDQYRIFVEWIQITGDHSFCHPNEPANKDHRPVIADLELFARRDQPITGVDWYDAYSFASWAGMRLPTEAEWEKAARGIHGNKWPWGNESGLLDGKLQALYDDTLNITEHPKLAGVYDHLDGASPFEVLGMAGNIWEYCLDTFELDWHPKRPYHNPINQIGGVMAVAKGGSWASNEHDAMSAIRIGIGKLNKQLDGKNCVGFRCASDKSDPIGMIGPMRHLKPAGSSNEDRSTWNTIVHKDGYYYMDGDSIASDGLFLKNGDRASLNDFLIQYSTPPPLYWMKKFSEIDIRRNLRSTSSVIWTSNLVHTAKEHLGKGSDHAKGLLSNLLELELNELKELSNFHESIIVLPQPLKSLNGFAKIDPNGNNIIIVYSNLLAIHDTLAKILAGIKLQEITFQQKKEMIEIVSGYVRESGASKNLPLVPSTSNMFPILSDIYSKIYTKFVLLHELGHLVLEHPKEKIQTKEYKWAAEFQADRFAIERIGKINIKRKVTSSFDYILGAWFGFILTCEENNTSGTSTHPPMLERVNQIIKLDILDSEQFKRGVNVFAPLPLIT